MEVMDFRNLPQFPLNLGWQSSDHIRVSPFAANQNNDSPALSIPASDFGANGDDMTGDGSVEMDHYGNGYHHHHGHGPDSIGRQSPSHHPAAGYVSNRSVFDSKNSSSIRPVFPSSTFSQIQYQSTTTTTTTSTSTSTSTAIINQCVNNKLLLPPLDPRANQFGDTPFRVNPFGNPFGGNPNDGGNGMTGTGTSTAPKMPMTHCSKIANSHCNIPIIQSLSDPLNVSPVVTQTANSHSTLPMTTRSVWDCPRSPVVDEFNSCVSPSFCILNREMSMHLPLGSPALSPKPAMPSPLKKSSFWVDGVDDVDNPFETQSYFENAAFGSPSYVDGDFTLYDSDCLNSAAMFSLVPRTVISPMMSPNVSPNISPFVDFQFTTNNEQFVESETEEKGMGSAMEEEKVESLETEQLERSPECRVKEEVMIEGSLEEEVKAVGMRMDIDIQPTKEEQENVNVKQEVNVKGITGGNVNDINDGDDIDLSVSHPEICHSKMCHSKMCHLDHTVDGQATSSEKQISYGPTALTKKVRSHSASHSGPCPNAKIKCHPRKRKRFTKKRIKKESKMKSRFRRGRYDDGVRENVSTKKLKLDFNQCILQTVSSKKCQMAFLEHLKVGDVVCEGDNKQNVCKIGKCSIKPRTFLSKCHLTRHVAESHTNRRYRCLVVKDECTAEFRQRSQLMEHIKMVHLRVKKPWKCPYCDQSFTRWGGVSRHLSLARCSAMKKGYLSRSQIQQIVNDATEGTKEFKAQCRN